MTGRDYRPTGAELAPGLQDRLERAKALIRGMESALVAFSGGVDSTLLARLCRDVLGDKAAAVTASSETYPSLEFEEAQHLAEDLGLRHMTVETCELEIRGFADNPPDRCYHCKRHLFARLRRMADDLGLKHVADGANADDAGDFRPGLRAARELGVRSPLKEAGLTKEEVRAVSRHLGLPTWNKPSYACLASRFPYGQEITRPALKMVDRAEEFLRALGLGQLRVRHHGDIARIEVGADDIEHLAAPDLRRKITKRLKGLGYAYVTLDLQGYRTGSMNEVLAESVKDAAR